MIRYTLLITFLLLLTYISIKDWYKALCFLIPITAVMERPDMPGEMFGITGMSPYNIALLQVGLAWSLQKKKEHLKWEIPKKYKVFLTFYLVLFTISFLRMIDDTESVTQIYEARNVEPPNSTSLIVDNFMNVIKWVIPGILLSMGATSEIRYRMATYSMALTIVVISLQVIRKMVPALIDGEDLGTRALRVLDAQVGYHRVDLSSITGAGAWLCLIISQTIVNSRSIRYASLVGFLVCSLAMLLTGGRAGFVAYLVCGLFFSWKKFKKLLLLGPVFLVLLITFVPGAQERLFEGFSENSHSSRSRDFDTVDNSGRDLDAITSGRVLVWPLVIQYIEEKPFLGHGKLGMMRSGVILELAEKIGEGAYAFPHPHNAYLELLLDMGFFGALPIFLFFALVTLSAAKDINHLDETRRLSAGVVLAFLITQLVSYIGSLSFYPAAGQILLWCAIGLYLRSLTSTFSNSSGLFSDPKPIIGAERQALWQKRFKYPNS